MKTKFELERIVKELFNNKENLKRGGWLILGYVGIMVVFSLTMWAIIGISGFEEYETDDPYNNSGSVFYEEYDSYYDSYYDFDSYESYDLSQPGTTSSDNTIPLIVSIPIMILVSLGIFTYSWYVAGYTLSIQKEIAKSGEILLPKHNFSHFGYGLKGLGLGLGYSLYVFGLLLVLGIIFGIPLVATLMVDLKVLAVLIGILGMLVLFVLVFTIAIFVYPAMMYYFVTHDSIGAALSLKNWKYIIKEYWLSFLATYGVVFGISMVFSFVGMFLQFIPILGMLLYMALTYAISLFVAVIWGDQFHQIKAFEEKK